MNRSAARLACLAIAAAASSVAARADQLTLDGTEIVLAGTAGNRRGADVVGVQLDLPGYGALTIASAERDAQSRFGDIWLYQFNRDGMPLCEADPHGDTCAVLFSGHFDGALHYHADPARFSLSCVSGVQAKCLRWGYEPWRPAPRTGKSLAPFYQACVRLARADYCGDDQPTTRAGTTIDIYDRVGVQQPDLSMTELVFEAGWTPDGAVCVHHARIADKLKLADLPTQCPRLQAEVLGESCGEAAAGKAGAILFNRSKHNAGP